MCARARARYNHAVNRHFDAIFHAASSGPTWGQVAATANHHPPSPRPARTDSERVHFNHLFDSFDDSPA